MTPPPRLLSSETGKGWIFFTYDDIPGTVNHGRSKRGQHWTKDREFKKEWEGIYLSCFLRERLPRKLEHVKVWFSLQFIDPGRRRDTENYRHPVTKPFADALVKAGYLDDDTDQYYEVAGLAISETKLVLTDTQKMLGRRACLHVAMLYRLPPDAPERQHAGGTRLQASNGVGEAADSRGARG